MGNIHYTNMSLENIEGETWNDIPGYDGVYQASNLGRIKSCERIDCNGRLRREKIRKQTKTSKGILAIPLHLHGKIEYLTVQAVIFSAFNGLKPSPKIKVGHKNKMLLDNRLENLELQSQKQVVSDSIRFGNMNPSLTFGSDAAKKTAEAFAQFDPSDSRRICTRCFCEKPLTDFHKRDCNPKGKNRICADCKNKESGVIDVGKNKYLKELKSAGLKRCKKCDTVKEETAFISELGTNHFYCIQCMRTKVKGIKKHFDDLFYSGLRNCTKCKTIKPFSDFNKLKSGRGGYGYVCKLCNRDTVTFVSYVIDVLFNCL